jgi:hypothetical protein
MSFGHGCPSGLLGSYEAAKKPLASLYAGAGLVKFTGPVLWDMVGPGLDGGFASELARRDADKGARFSRDRGALRG